MSDPLGFVSGSGGAGMRPIQPVPGVGGAGKSGSPGDGGADFREVLLENLAKVNNAQQEADAAVEDLVSGRRSDVEGVILATEKADNAFRMLQAMRGKVLQAYDEIKQVRV
jgi:flagellar hook-basal body complex protein FliE